MAGIYSHKSTDSLKSILKYMNDHKDVHASKLKKKFLIEQELNKRLASQVMKISNLINKD